MKKRPILFLILLVNSFFLVGETTPEVENATSVILCSDASTVLHFDFDACLALSAGSNINYSEFTATSPDESECTDFSVQGGNLYRQNPENNGHSCTPGFNGNAMCVSSLADCEFAADNDKAIRFDIVVTPGADGIGSLSGISFYEKAPLTYEWINGDSGPNNFPEAYGIRVTANGVEVYLETDIPTGNEWSLQEFDFSDFSEFSVMVETVFSFELLGYCTQVGGPLVRAWDIDELSILSCCAAPCEVEGGTLAGGPFEFCAGDGEADNIPADAITLTGNSGPNSQWVVTDDQGNILGLPPTFDAVDFDGAGVGNCLVWHLSFEDDLTGAAMGLNANDLGGCFSLSNPITVTRNQPEGGTLEGGPFTFCAGDGVADNIPADAITLTGNSGANSQWVVTDDQGNILGLPPTFDAVDFDGAGVGNCLVWHLSFDGDLTGAAMGMNANDLGGCFSLSNPITVTRNQPEGGTLEGGPFTFCAGDGVADNIPADAITLTGNSGANSQWVVTDDQGNILGLPPTFDVVDFDGAGVGNCLVWHLSFDGDLTGAAMGMNANDLGGCFSLSNPITVTRNQPEGGTLEGGPFTFCAGDGVADNIPADAITLTGNSGANSQWVVTDDQGNILGLPPTFDVVDFDGAGVGNCLVWHLSFDGDLTGAEMGMNANDLGGCFSLSNPITVTRNQPEGGMLEGGPFAFCAGDGEADNIPADAITLTGNSGANSQWVVTDDQGNILGLPPTFDVVDFDGAGGGACLVWHLSFDGDIVGAEMGMNANDLQGCFSLSNPITVVRDTIGGACDADCNVEGGTITGGPFEFCAGDGEADNIPADAITLTGEMGMNSQWVVTDEQGNILGLPPTFDVVDFDGAGAGNCLVWHLSFDGDLTGAEMGMNANDIGGCFDLSNSISVIRNQPEGGTLEGGPFAFCAGDGEVDNIPADAITLTGNSGANSQWVVTDDQGNILGLPPTFDVVDFDGAGGGACLVWHLSFDGDIVGAEMGMNANDLQGCFSLSNPITVVRDTIGGACDADCNVEGGTITGGPFEFCAGDGEADNIPADAITLTGEMGMNSQWVVTDEQGNILGLPPTFDVVDFDVAGAGNCLVWHLSFDGDLTGAEMGMNANDIGGCFDLSNSISVIRNQPEGGTLEGGPFEFCAGDGEADNIPADGITLTGNFGANSQWVVTDDQGMILGLPGNFADVDFDDAGVGTCLVWHLSFDGDLTGAEMGMNANDIEGCFSLSNPITVVRDETGAVCEENCTAEGGTLEGGPFEFCAGDMMADNIPVDAITLTGNSGTNSQWVVTDEQGMILGLPGNFSDVDFNIAGAGTCLVWHLSFEDGLTGAEMGMNADDLEGCFDLSNPISVVRTTPIGGALSTAAGETEITICAGDGTSDAFDIILNGNTGANSVWVITDASLEILALPMAPPFDLEGAGAGVCLVWHLSFEDGLTGAEVGMNANDLEGCFSLSNPITVNRDGVDGGSISGGPYEFCVSDGEADFIPTGEVAVTGNSGENSQWIVTSDAGVILGLPTDPSDVDFDGAGPGACLIWHISHTVGIEGLELDLNIANLDGCFSLSNSVEVVRLEGADCDGGVGEAIIVVNEINGNGEVELANIGTTSQDVSSYWLCNFPAYSQMSNLTIVCGGDLILDPGEIVTVNAGFTIDPADGEMGLYIINDYSDPNDIIDYVEWGSSGHQRSSVAVNANIWTAGDFAAAFTAPNSLEYDGGGDASTDWSEDAASPCVANVVANGGEVAYKIFPNPANDNITIQFLNITETSSNIEIYDAVGNRVETMTHDISEGITKEVNVEGYRSGAYFIKVSTRRSNNVQRFMKIVK